MFLFFHLEADGLPKSWKASHTDTQNWPKISKIAWATFDKFGGLMTEQTHTITNDADTSKSNIHIILETLAKEISGNKYVISHNFDYQSKVLGSAFHVSGIDHKLFFAESFCTMREGTYFCGIRGRYGKLKWPKLNELFSKIFSKPLVTTESPLSEVKATAACLFALVKMEEIDLF